MDAGRGGADQSVCGAEVNDDIAYFIDGNMWCAVRLDFFNLQESPAGFGETREEAATDLEREEEKWL